MYNPLCELLSRVLLTKVFAIRFPLGPADKMKPSSDLLIHNLFVSFGSLKEICTKGNGYLAIAWWFWGARILWFILYYCCHLVIWQWCKCDVSGCLRSSTMTMGYVSKAGAHLFPATAIRSIPPSTQCWCRNPSCRTIVFSRWGSGESCPHREKKVNIDSGYTSRLQ